MRPLDAFFTPSEQRLLALVLADPNKDFGTVELITQMGNSRSVGSTLLQRWVETGVLRERKIGNNRRLSANPDFLLYPELRKIAMKTVGLAHPLVTALTPFAEKLKEAFVFGSVAKGTDSSTSDIDLALVGSVDLFEVSPILDRLEKELGRPVHANIYSEEEWLSTADPVLKAIKSGPRIDLTGELHEKTR